MKLAPAGSLKRKKASLLPPLCLCAFRGCIFFTGFPLFAVLWCMG